MKPHAATPTIRWILMGALSFLAALPLAALERLEPVEGCYFGISHQPGETIPRLSSRLGMTPAVYVRFFHFPMSASGHEGVKQFLDEVTLFKAIALLTLEPHSGLPVISENDCQTLADLCAVYEDRGIGGIFIRFGHEMNGNWYPWGQQPILFKTKFQLLARILHSKTARTAMLWAPNYGIGYPFGTARPAPGSPDFLLLDTNRDGRISDRDDMYEPYYPGDEFVDWVGMTLYHWGIDYPWLENELAPPNSFARSLTGTLHGTIPNFYQRYCADAVRRKPLAIPETAAFYNTQRSGVGEFEIKQSWWRQVFNISGDGSNGWDIASHFPKLKCINWFDEYKQETEAQNHWIDWRISADPRIRAAFVGRLRVRRNGQPYFLVALDGLAAKIDRDGPGMVVICPSETGRHYQLYGTSDFSVWTPASEPISGTGGPIRFPLDSTSTKTMVIFRVHVEVR